MNGVVWLRDGIGSDTRNKLKGALLKRDCSHAGVDAQ